ncbi:443_t:CDS:2 [Funneliformis caledonium]|uniref:443_t:CDS:1 n=1 Tax=Funneliformis caledonium TaxID=1117310 RepID=A0A9N9E172_9GLOM|nr:443_t:CDS:2 [Funneliformis caledonium]
MNNILSVLKEILKEKRSPCFDDFASDELILWRNTVEETFHDLREKNIQVVFGTPASARSYYKMQVDMTALICDALIQSFDTVPSQVDDLKPLYDAPLIRKLPVSFYEEKKFPQVAEFIKTSDDECGSILANNNLKSRT